MEERRLLEKYQSPLYVYEEELLEKRTADMINFAERLKKELEIPAIKMHYSTKANGNLQILKKIQKMGIAVDAMSPVELRLVEMAGFNKDDILYVCNNVSVEEMIEVVDKGIKICLDSISQVELLGKKRPNIDIMVRVNPGLGGVGHSEKVITAGKEAKFGITEKNIEELLLTCEKYNIRVVGIHQHLGSLFLDDNIDQFITGVESLLNIAKKYLPDLEIVDLGGGFGVPYKENEKDLDLNIVIEKLKPVLSNFITEYHMVEFKFEPGRYIPCESCYILGTVHAVKNENNKIWVGTDIGMNTLVRPSMYDAYHKIEVIKEEGNDKEYITATIVGNICESADVLGKDRQVATPEVGDVVKIYNAGAYGYSMSSNYTGRQRPAEVLIDKEGKDILIRKRETIEEVISRNV